MHLRAVEVLVVNGGKKLDGDEDGLAGLRVIEERNLFEVFAERDAAAVEVDDLGHRPVGPRDEPEADVDAGEVVAVEGFGNGDALAIPDGVLAGGGLRFGHGPGAVVERRRFAVRQVAFMHAPAAVGQRVELHEAVHGLLLFRFQLWSDPLFVGWRFALRGEDGSGNCECSQAEQGAE